MPRPNGSIIFSLPITLVDQNTYLEQISGGNLRIGARVNVGLYSSLFSQNYAFFGRAESAYIAPRTTITNTSFAMLRLRHNTSGTPAAGFGASLDFELESSTTEDRSAARIAAVWQTATDATRKADLVLSAFDTAEREGLRIRATGSAAAIGFLGATPVARPEVTGSAGGNAALASLLTALANLGLITDSST